MRGGRFSRGWRLAKQSWAVLRADRSLLAFPVIAGVSGLAALAIVMGPGIALYEASGQSAPILIAALTAGAAAPVGYGLIGLAVVVLVVAMLVGGTLNAIFRMALYRYATAGQTGGGFALADLEGAFIPKRRRGRLR